MVATTVSLAVSITLTLPLPPTVDPTYANGVANARPASVITSAESTADAMNRCADVHPLATPKPLRMDIPPIWHAGMTARGYDRRGPYHAHLVGRQLKIQFRLLRTWRPAVEICISPRRLGRS